MRILFLTPDLPLPADQGAKLRNAALIRAAAALHQVDLGSFAIDWDRSEPEADTRALVRRLEVVPAPPLRSLATRALNLALSPLPDLATRLESQFFIQALKDLTADQRYDVVQIEGLEMMPYLSAVRTLASEAAVIYDAHNAEMSMQRSMFQVEFRNPLRWPMGIYSFLQWSKLGTYERITMNAADMVLCVSDADAAKLRGRRTDPQLVPNGIDANAVEYRPPPPQSTSTLFFVGPLDYRPNGDAVRWLVSSVLPRLRRLVPNVRVRFAGRGTEHLRGPGFEGLGYVEDVHAELARASVLVVPMRMGGGVRFKVLEAMAAGLPVVSTALGLTGIAAEDGQHALVADSPDTFAEAVARLLADRPLAR
ncbi:MAG: glycosyltransferase, partial [Chloroflexi bacterium]|nr:glycosyltransferase [Chloroflexota bacterium]